MLVNSVLALIVLIAVGFDLRVRRIPNHLIILAVVFAFSYYLYQDGLNGLLFSFQGFGLGLALLLLPFLMGGIGAGDVKFLAAIGAMKGSLYVFNTFLWMAIWGGFIALIILIYQRKLGETLARIKNGFIMTILRVGNISDSLSKEELSVYFPYGLAIALGALTSYFKGWC